MKLSEVVKGTQAVKPVPFKPATAARPGAAPSGDSADFIQVGVRVLTGEETAEVYKLAQAFARDRGVAEWKGDHPLCRLGEMAHTVALACVDVDQTTGQPKDPSRPEPFFDGGVKQVLDSSLVGTDNIAYLYGRWQDWQDSCSILTKTLTPGEAIAIMMAEAERPENADSPLDLMQPGLQRTLLRISAVLLRDSLKGKSPSTLLGDLSGNDGSMKSDPPGVSEDDDGVLRD